MLLVVVLGFFFNIIFECSWKWSPCICLYFHRCQTDARIQSNFFWNQMEFFTWLEFKHLLLAISEKERKKSKIIQSEESGHQNFLCSLRSLRNWINCKLYDFPNGYQSWAKAAVTMSLWQISVQKKWQRSPSVPCWNTSTASSDTDAKSSHNPELTGGSKSRSVEWISLYSTSHHLKTLFDWKQNKTSDR